MAVLPCLSLVTITTNRTAPFSMPVFVPPSAPRSQREWNKNRRSPSPPLEGVKDLREMLSRRASGRGADAAAAGAAAGAAAAAAAAAASAGAPADRDLPPGIGRSERERRCV